MQKILEALAVLILALVMAFVLTAIPAALWYCFDDALADLTGVAKLGHLSFWTVYPAFLCIALVLGRSSAPAKKDK